ncbi:hypothetical protein Tco_1490820 [Tanacetum coccineum]
MRIEEYLNVTFEESLPEPKSSPSIEDDRIIELVVQDPVKFGMQMKYKCRMCKMVCKCSWLSFGMQIVCKCKLQIQIQAINVICKLQMQSANANASCKCKYRLQMQMQAANANASSFEEDDLDALAFEEDDPYALAFEKECLALVFLPLDFENQIFSLYSSVKSSYHFNKLLDGPLLDTMSGELYTIYTEVLFESELLSELKIIISAR